MLKAGVLHVPLNPLGFNILRMYIINVYILYMYKSVGNVLYNGRSTIVYSVDQVCNM